MSPSQIIVLATPVFFVLIAIELAVGYRRRRPAYRLADAMSSISLGMLSQTSAVFTRLLRIGIYTALFQQMALWRSDAFWLSVPGWLLALVFYDLCYYWLHRMGHESAVLWAAHAVHHQSQDYNLSTALRQTSSGALFGWIFYVPMAVAGVPPLVFAVVALIDLLYQFWVHTEQIPRFKGRLEWFDRWFCSPSNHRVHHAVNDAYLDKNYGGILIVWDRIFGTFKDEDPQERCVYGTRGLLNSWDPIWANTQVYASLAHDSWHTRRWPDKLRVWLKPPGWRPADVAQRFPKPAFSMAQMQLYHPPLTRTVQWFAAVQFVTLLAGVAAFLWQADSAPLAHNALWFGVLLASQWALGAVLQGRIGMLMALMLQSAALATATSALGFTQWHWLFKPLTLVIAIILVAACAGSVWAGGLESLEVFVSTVKTGRAEFTQVVSAPPKEGQSPRVKTSSGTFEFSRPNRFKFIYLKPFAQSIVADGQTLWLFDVDLNQATARKQSQVLGSTPAALIAAAPDLKALQADFTLADAPDKEGLQWVAATPKSKEGQLDSVRVGFRATGKTAELAALEILDSFGQRSLLTFSKVEVNPALAPDSFQFKPPAGTDVIRQ